MLFSAFMVFPVSLHADEEPLAEQVRNMLQHEAFTVKAIVQSCFYYSFDDDDFQGGRTFEAGDVRLSIRGILDKRFFYRIYFDLTREPNMLDMYVGYRHSDAFRLTAGAQKPKQSIDVIPGTHETDFIERTMIARYLVHSREIGLSAEGSLGQIDYYGGIFNGSRLRSNNNNKFYGIGRIQYTIDDLSTGGLQIGLQGSHGDSEGVRSGSLGPILRGNRTIFGADARLETDNVLFAAEYLTGILETQDLPDTKERISGLLRNRWVHDTGADNGTRTLAVVGTKGA